jgi:hypothetical protein
VSDEQDQQGSGRSVNFIDRPDSRARSGAKSKPERRPPGDPGPAGAVRRAPELLKRLPVPAPVALGVAALAFVLLGLGAVKLATGSSTPDDRATDTAAPPATAAAAPATAPPVTTAATAPLPTRPPAEEDAARRATFIESMKGMGLTPTQATCAADKVQATMGWTEISENLMQSGRAAELQAVLLDCVKTSK